MDQQEAERVAEAIQQSGLTGLEVYEVECVNHLAQDYQVKCGYRGKSKRLGDAHLEGGTMVWVKSPRHWAQLARIIRDGIVER